MENDKYKLIFQNVVVIVLIYKPTTVCTSEELQGVLGEVMKME